MRIHSQGFIIELVNTGRVRQLASRYDKDRAEEYSLGKLGSAIGELYPEG